MGDVLWILLFGWMLGIVTAVVIQAFDPYHDVCRREAERKWREHWEPRP